MERLALSTLLISCISTSILVGDELKLAGNKVKFSKNLTLNQLSTLDVDNKDISIIIKVKNSLSNTQKDKLYQLGVKSIEYAGVNSYYLLSSKDKITTIIKSIKNLKGVALLNKNYKISQELRNIDSNIILKVNVDFLKNIDKEELEDLLIQNGIDYMDLRIDKNIKRATITLRSIDIYRLSSIPIIKYIYKFYQIGLIKPLSIKLTVRDLKSAEDTYANKVWSGNLNLDGLNVKVGIVDEGRARVTHREFQIGKVSKIKNRVIKGDLSKHTTHVCGIITSNGINKNSQGMAKSVKIYNYSYEDIYFAKAISYLYNHEDILISNHSYGFTDNIDTGGYNSDASNIDNIVHSNPFLNVFMAAGNDRGSDGYKDISIIKGAANAKNIFTIGALDNYSDNVAYYSSTGPVNDGRIKPDLSIRGSSIYSTSSNSDSSYTYMSGTSMATPIATGLATLVIEEYKNLTDCGNGRGCDMRHDLLKSILVNTAVDKGAKGPDIYTGFGMINVQNAVEVVGTIKDRYQKFVIDSISKGGKKEYSFTTYQTKKFKATISWVDPAGNSASSGKTLVNDIDIYLVKANDSSKKYYPYVLDKTDYTKPALKAENHVDNIEQIEVDNLPAGSYKLVVNAKGLQTFLQEYAITSTEKMFFNDIKKKEQVNINNFAKIMLDAIY